MIITLTGATFSTSIGTLDSWFIQTSITGGGLTASGSNIKNIRKDDTAGATLTYTYDTENYKYTNGTVTDATGATVGSISGSNGTVTVTLNAGNTIKGKITIAILMEYIGSGEDSSTYTFTINPTPTSATVTLSATGYSTVSGTGSQNITVANGTSVSWSVSKSDYVEQNGTWIANGANETKNITLSEESDTGFVDPRLSHPQTKAGTSVPSDGIITQDMTVILEDCWMNASYAYLSWNPEGSGGEASGTYTDDYFYCYLPVDISGYTQIDVTANSNNAAYYQFFTTDLAFTTTGGRIKVEKGTAVTAQEIPSGAKYLLVAHHRIKEGAYSDYYPTTVKIYN